MTDSPANVAFYFVIGVVAHGYVVQYENEGVSPEFADKAKAIVVSFNKKSLKPWHRHLKQGSGCRVKSQPATNLMFQNFEMPGAWRHSLAFAYFLGN